MWRLHLKPGRVFYPACITAGLFFPSLRSAQRRRRLVFPGGVAFTCPHHTPAAPRPHHKSSFIPPTVHGNHQKIQIRLKFIQNNNNIIHQLSSELMVRTRVKVLEGQYRSFLLLGESKRCLQGPAAADMLHLCVTLGVELRGERAPSGCGSQQPCVFSCAWRRRHRAAENTHV